MTGKALPKAAGGAGWHDVNTLDCGWAFVIDHPKEREGACLCVLCKDVNLCRARERYVGVRAGGGVSSFLHLCWQGEERFSRSFCGSLSFGRLSPKSHPIPGQKLQQLPTLQNQRNAGPYWPGACLFQSHFSQVSFDIFALFPEMGEVSWSNSLTATDHPFQTKS